jgi:hypothetical protein
MCITCSLNFQMSQFLEIFQNVYTTDIYQAKPYAKRYGSEITLISFLKKNTDSTQSMKMLVLLQKHTQITV